jgi:poly(hydroxyalkanoate) depolymerase family esterase
MRTLADTIERLARLRARPQGLQEAASGLLPLALKGDNPGALAGWYQVPDTKGEPPALVVVLHGCTQNAAGYDRGAGWSALADAYGFSVLFPEQNRQNNGNLCFNWFVPQDVTRGSGEVASIRAMIQTMIDDHGVDPRRVYVTGLSAGGAMANTLLAVYPEVFAGGAIIAGLAHGIAASVPEAFDRMRGHGLPGRDGLQARLSAASPHAGPFPTISVWQGTADRTVDAANARAIVDQWRGALGAAESPSRADTLDGQERMIWTDAAGRDVIELVLVSGMGHGTPLDTESGYGEAAPYMLEAGISSTVHIARTFGLIASFDRKTNTRTASEQAGDSRVKGQADGRGRPETVPESVRDVIEGALRAAGLMK